tara:strand:+ start:1627 stop:1881 length:255 start_codon:yes stop_codon:yes gene_type:complete
MSGQVGLTEKELEKIYDIQNRIQTSQIELGKVELMKMDIEERRKTIERYIIETRSLETDIAKEFEDKYGEGAIDLDQKVFIPKQ